MAGDKKRYEKPIIMVMSGRDEDRYDHEIEDRMADAELDYEQEDCDDGEE